MSEENDNKTTKTRPLLFYDDLNPQSRAVLILIDMLNVDVEMHYLKLVSGNQLKVDFRGLNPVHSVPTLFFDGFVLSDSHAILIYICEKFKSGGCEKLYPSCFRKRMNILNKLFFDSSILSRRHSQFSTEVMLRKYPNVDLQFHIKRIIDAYTIMETFLEENIYVAGKKFTIADISIVATVGALDMMFPIDNEFPKLLNWFNDIRAMPSYKLTEEGLEKQRTVLQETGGFDFSDSTRRSRRSTYNEMQTSTKSRRSRQSVSIANDNENLPENIKRKAARHSRSVPNIRASDNNFTDYEQSKRNERK